MTSYQFWLIPRLWPGETVVCIGGGPSLTPEDVNACRGRARVIAINNAYQLAPWADILYACGLYASGKCRSWWTVYPEAGRFPGLKVTLDPDAHRDYGAMLLARGADTGLETDPTKLASGWNSGYQAINLAVHLGAARILLLGYDMQRGPDDPREPEGCRHHWHGNHPGSIRPPYTDWLLAFSTLPAPLRAAGVEVVNCTRQTALTVFPQMPLAEALCPLPSRT